MSISIRPYRESDFDALFVLWQAALDASWPIRPDYLTRMLTRQERYQDGGHFVAEADGKAVGFVATQTHPARRESGIPLLLVLPDYQRRGIGMQLHTAAMEHLHSKGVDRIKLAHGGGDYFWPGVPLNLPGAVEFFKACGWQFEYTCCDLTRDLIDYQTPKAVMERIAPHNVAVRPASSANEVAMIIDFEGRAFPSWSEYFQLTANDGRYGDIIAAWDEDRVIGSLLIDKKDIAALDSGGVWHSILGDPLGTLGAVGTDEAYRERGIGLAMVAKGSEILQARGVRQCIIGWTYLLSFYGRLGYKEWRSYAMPEDRLA